jgi:hypothetical protein
MADGGGSVAREESGADLLYTRVRWRGDSQVHQDGKVTVWRGVRQRRGAGTAAAPVAGSGPSGRRRQDRRARTRGTRRVAQGECGKKAARRKWGGGLRRADRGTEAYLGVRAQRDCDAGRCATPASRVTPRVWRDWPSLKFVWPCLNKFFSKILTEVVQGVDSKVVDLIILYNFYKGRMAFFSTLCAQIASKVCCFLGACE